MQFTMEQELQLRLFADKVQQMNLEQAQFFLNELYKQMIFKDVMYQELLRKQWGLEDDAISLNVNENELK